MGAWNRIVIKQDLSSLCFLRVCYSYGLTYSIYIIKTIMSRFNRKPKRGIAFLNERKLLGETADEVAYFFHTDDRLDKTIIGEFLGEPEKFNIQVFLDDPHNML